MTTGGTVRFRRLNSALRSGTVVKRCQIALAARDLGLDPSTVARAIYSLLPRDDGVAGPKCFLFDRAIRPIWRSRVRLNQVYSILYRSTPVRPMLDGELLWLLNQARAENSRLGLTGLLLYKDGSFMQMLEGNMPELEKLYAKIEQDPRHRSVTLLRTEFGPRVFPHWTMGFQNLRKWRMNQPEIGVSDMMSEAFDADYFGPNPTKSQSLMLCFRGLGS